ncbi:hypothetical protein ACQEVB_18015 [Pseudonocardia sp. CA-107938]|uniref:hypothetical protein n=1 Tax=Pseudonocardia sp. CA-107938 TaxID=3240021 RepID=UPI003D8B54FE
MRTEIAIVLAGGEPAVWQRLMGDHVSDASGRCIACRVHGVGGPRWPCSLRAVAEAAHELVRSDRQMPADR